MTHHGPVAFIGGGNMARSLIGGLVAQGMSGADIGVAEPVAALREALARDFGVRVFENNADAVAGALAVLVATWFRIRYRRSITRAARVNSTTPQLPTPN